MTADWTGIVVDILSEVDCFFSVLKIPAVFLRQKSLAYWGFDGGSEYCHSFLSNLSNLPTGKFPPVGRSSRESHHHRTLYKYKRELTLSAAAKFSIFSKK